jgi:hypothetical protein
VRRQYGVKFPIRHTSAPSDRTALLIEILRYAGVISKEDSADGTVTHITMWCRLRADSSTVAKMWQSSNLNRVRSFGITAEPVEQEV